MAKEDKMSKNNKTVDRMQAVWNKLGGEEGVDKLLRGELAIVARARVFETWITINLGTFIRVEQILHGLNINGFSILGCVEDIFYKNSFTLADRVCDTELVNISVQELGFEAAASYNNICKRAWKIGLDLCPAEVGPQLRLQYSHRPNGGCVDVAMKPIINSGGSKCIFRVESNAGGSRCLSVSSGDPNMKWNLHRRFVFVRRKSKE